MTNEMSNNMHLMEKNKTIRQTNIYMAGSINPLLICKKH
jgi:hypothetical protein